MGASLTTILQALAIFSALLLTGTFLRAKVKLFQKLYIPSCVIGGFIGLILGPNGFGLLPFSEDIMAVASNLSGILIIPILASLPMCMSLGGASISKSGTKMAKDVLVIAIILSAAPMFQFAIGLTTNVAVTAAGGNTFPTLGLDMAMGFMGGHGMAASLGSSLQAAGDPNWEVAQGMAVSAATIGLVSAILFGVWFINYAAKKGYTSQIKGAAETTLEMRVGLYAKGQECPNMGKQTTVANSIETLSLHIGVMFLACGGGYILQSWISKLNISFLSSMATWFYGMMVMWVIWFLICKLKVDYLFDETIKNKLNGMFSDYLIVAAITSIPLSVVATYWVALVIECAVGFVVTVLITYFVCKRFLNNNWFETSLGPLGSNLGVFVTGMLLIKMADPDLKTSALTTYSLGYSLPSFITMPLISFVILFTYSYGAFKGIWLNVGLTLLCGVLLLVFCRKPKENK